MMVRVMNLSSPRRRLGGSSMAKAFAGFCCDDAAACAVSTISDNSNTPADTVTVTHQAWFLSQRFSDR